MNILDNISDNENIIEGKNAVIEAIRAGRALDKVFLARGSSDKALGFIAASAKAAGVVVTDCDRRKLDAMDSACLSVFTAMNSTPLVPELTILFTTLLPAPPMPTTLRVTTFSGPVSTEFAAVAIFNSLPWQA